jgi:hypothetical protein
VLSLGKDKAEVLAMMKKQLMTLKLVDNDRWFAKMSMV